MLNVPNVISTVLTLCALKFHLDFDTSECMYYRERERERKGEGEREKAKFLFTYKDTVIF